MLHVSHVQNIVKNIIVSYNFIAFTPNSITSLALKAKGFLTLPSYCCVGIVLNNFTKKRFTTRYRKTIYYIHKPIFSYSSFSSHSSSSLAAASSTIHQTSPQAIFVRGKAASPAGGLTLPVVTSKFVSDF